MTGSGTLLPKKLDCERCLGRFVVLAMAIAAFGPYVTGGIRTEQAVVYGLVALFLPFRAPFLYYSGGLKFIVPWIVMFVVSLIGVFFPLRAHAAWQPGGILAGMDNLLLPVAVMLVVWCTVTPLNAEKLLESVAKIVVWAMSANAILAILDTRFDLSAFLRPFWGNEELVSTTAERAASMGRISGIFNQPSEAGIVYGLAGLLTVYLYQRESIRLSFFLLLITVGGLLTVSKIFIIAAIPLILVYTWRSRTGGSCLTFLLSAALISGGVVQSPLLKEWGGANYLTRLFDPPETANLVAFYTAGRWTSGSDVFDVIGTALSLSPLAGVGAGGWDVAYDSSWTQAIVVAGLMGVACLLALYASFFLLVKMTADRKRRSLAFFLGLFLLAASFGIPALSANRAATLIWLVVALLVLANASTSADGRQSADKGGSARDVADGSGVSLHTGMPDRFELTCKDAPLQVASGSTSLRS